MERLKQPMVRLAIVGGLLCTTLLTGVWGWWRYRQPKTGPQPLAAIGEQLPMDPALGSIPPPVDPLAADASMPADPTAGGNPAWNREVTPVGYQDAPGDDVNPANPAAMSVPDLAPPATVTTAGLSDEATPDENNPYRRTRGGSFGSASLSDPMPAPESTAMEEGTHELPEPPPLNEPAGNMSVGGIPPAVAALADSAAIGPVAVVAPEPAAEIPSNPYSAPTTTDVASIPEAPSTPSEPPLQLAPAAEPQAALEIPASPPPQQISSDSYANSGYGNNNYGNSSYSNENYAQPAAGSYEASPRASEPSTFSSGINGAAPARPLNSLSADHQASAVPGDRRLEGTQAPALAMEKQVPVEIQINKPATFLLHVRNVGQSVARNVVVTDQVPRGTSLQQTKPQADQAPDGSLVWNLGDLSPGKEVTVEMVLLPQAEGEIGSVAQVSCQALASARTVCTRPTLVIDHIGPQQVLIGETVSLAITLTNTGTGPATGVVIEEDVPSGLIHAAGRELEYDVGTLKPGETRRMELTLKASEAGIVENIVSARGEGGLHTEHRAKLEVIAPQLQVEINGPKRRYLDRQATYEVSLANPGTAVAQNVDLTAFLPRGMKFVSADSEGQYDPSRHAVLWSLEALPPGKQGMVKVTTVPREPGEHVLRVETRGDRNLSSAGEQMVTVEAAPELVFSVVDLSDPIEVGSETGYEVHIVNNGTKAASNVQLAVLFPAELQALGGDGPTRSAGDGQRVVFDPIPRLQPREEVAFKVTGKAIRAGDVRVKVQITSDDEPQPVTKEESTRIYADQ